MVAFDLSSMLVASSHNRSAVALTTVPGQDTATCILRFNSIVPQRKVHSDDSVRRLVRLIGVN